MVEVCVLVTSGTLEREATVILSSVDDEAVGKKRAGANRLMSGDHKLCFHLQRLETMMLL